MKIYQATKAIEAVTRLTVILLWSDAGQLGAVPIVCYRNWLISMY